MVRPGLRPDLLAALQFAQKQGGTVVRKGVRFPTPGSVRRVTLIVTPLSQPGPLDGLMMVVFDAGAARAVESSSITLRQVRPSSKGRGVSLELEYAQQRLHRTNTDLQVSNEEFKSSNEELQSTNEELQSTNEELETTKEELQSLNEELITVNTQLQNKFEEAANANDDLKNLVNSTEVATIFLDSELRIKRFTPDASRVSKLIATDIGRPFEDIVSKVRYEGLLDDARTVLRTLVFTEREVQAEDGHWYLLRIMPYRTSKNLIDGVVLTYMDITAYKHAARRAESIVDRVPTPLIMLDTDLRVVTANRSFYQVFARERREVERHPIDRILEGRFNHPALRTVVEKRFIDETGVDTIELERESLPVGEGRWRASISRIEPADGEAPLMLLALQHGPDTHR
jgi:two-component system CheB/CheR fusion protein